MVDGGSWTQYTGTFELCQSGLHMMYWYWTYQGEESEELFIVLLIDRDIPQLQLSQERISINRVKINAEVNDQTSGPNRVEFAVDGDLWYVDNTLPYEGILFGYGIYQVTATAFDDAGNSVNSTITTSLKTQNPFQHIHSFLLRLFFHIHTYDILDD
jgi:hypothetical protein